MKALGSLADVERELRAAGFFEGGATASSPTCTSGTGSRDALRRTDVPDPPEPCPLPAAAVGIRPVTSPRRRPARSASASGSATWDEAAYGAPSSACATAIAAGDVYQVNLVQHLSAPFRGDPAGLAAALAPLRPLEPRPLAGDGWAVVSASPELFLSRRGRRVWTKPIKGTRPLGADDLPSPRRTPPST